MPDYGHDLLFGCSSRRSPSRPRRCDPGPDRRRARPGPLDRAGPPVPAALPRHLDAALRTSPRAPSGCGCSQRREPAAAAAGGARPGGRSLDILSDGRVELGLGAGAFWDAIEAMGGPRRSPGEAVRRWRRRSRSSARSGSRAAPRASTASTTGWHGAKPGRRRAPDRHLARRLRPRMLRLTGRLADGWLPSQGYAPPERLPDMNARSTRPRPAAGRTPRRCAASTTCRRLRDRRPASCRARPTTGSSSCRRRWRWSTVDLRLAVVSRPTPTGACTPLRRGGRAAPSGSPSSTSAAPARPHGAPATASTEASPGCPRHHVTAADRRRDPEPDAGRRAASDALRLGRVGPADRAGSCGGADVHDRGRAEGQAPGPDPRPPARRAGPAARPGRPGRRHGNRDIGEVRR